MENNFYSEDLYRFRDEYDETYSKNPLPSKRLLDDIENMKKYGDRKIMMDKQVYFVNMYKDERESPDIVNIKNGALYLDRSLIPKGLDYETGRFSFSYVGKNSISYQGMYIVFDSDLEDENNPYKKIREFKDRETANEIYSYLLSNNIENIIELDGTKIFIYNQEGYVNSLINEFLETYESKEREYTEYQKFTNFQSVDYIIDDDYIFGGE